MLEDTELKKGNSKKLVELTQSEEDGILFMREFEKFAYDAYQQFYDSYGHNVFLNISNAEQNHMDAMLHLIEFYGLTDLTIGETGQFTNEELQLFYDYTMSEVTDLISSLYACKEIEEKMISELTALMAETEVKNLDKVYEHHLKVSEKHLTSFNFVIEKLEAKAEKLTSE